MDVKELERPEDIDKYLKSTGLAMASDYSDEYLQNVRYLNQKAEKDDCFNDFIQQYKKKIWSTNGFER